MPIVMLNDENEYELFEADFDSWADSCSRILINGPPLSGKTSSLITFPASRHILVAPGELGASSIREDEFTKVYTFRFDPTDDFKFQPIWKSVQELTKDILRGSFGKVHTFAIDGLHKLYYFIQKALGYTSSTDPREFARYHETFIKFLTPILASNIPIVVATCYDGVETEDIKGADGKSITSIYPALPGRMAKDIMGMFPLVFHSERSGSGKEQEFKWRLRAKDRIQGAGAHFPAEVRDMFPAFTNQNWKEVSKIIEASKKSDITKGENKENGKSAAKETSTNRQNSTKTNSSKTTTRKTNKANR